jgi:hypothetical protein
VFSCYISFPTIIKGQVIVAKVAGILQRKIKLESRNVETFQISEFF